ncbi:30S ribosomal protein S20 [Ruminococcaceae bacterium OttesenSCG-928-O06]|nr:30S ribosomal protein S20 [Ruminococcaceae bacterium OttesenSCG-928-O06]
MPNIKSQKDRVRLSAKQTARNKAAKSALRTAVKKANASIEAGAENKDALVNAATVALSKAGGKGLVHKNTASRKVSRMMKKANAQPQ